MTAPGRFGGPANFRPYDGAIEQLFKPFDRGVDVTNLLAMFVGDDLNSTLIVESTGEIFSNELDVVDGENADAAVEIKP